MFGVLYQHPDAFFVAAAQSSLYSLRRWSFHRRTINLQLPRFCGVMECGRAVLWRVGKRPTQQSGEYAARRTKRHMLVPGSSLFHAQRPARQGR